MTTEWSGVGFVVSANVGEWKFMIFRFVREKFDVRRCVVFVGVMMLRQMAEHATRECFHGVLSSECLLQIFC